MSPNADSAKPFFEGLSPATRRSLGENVLDGLRAAIVRGRVAPGEHLNEAALADAFGVSRGPIRDALAVLEREGLVVLERHRGARVKRLSQTDIDEIYELRAALERLAVERALQFATAEDVLELDAIIERMKAAVKARDVHSVVECDVSFHDQVYKAAHHSRLYASWANLRPQIETFLYSRSLDDRDYLKRAVREHSELRDMIRARVKRGSAAMISDHLRTAYERLSEISETEKETS